MVARFDAWQRRHAVGGLPVAVYKKFSEDRATNLAALTAYYAFFSLFPLMLALVSILGFVLDDNPQLRDDIVDTALGRIPVIGPQLRGEVQPLTGSGLALAVGLIGALWAGLGVTVALGRAFAEIWDVPRVDQPNGLRARGRGLAVLFILGVTLVAATAAAGLAAGGGFDPVEERGAALVGSLAVNGVVFLTVFGLLTPRPRELRDLLPGVAVAAIGWAVLQGAGGWYVNHAVKDATLTYGTFALVIGLLSWFYIGAHLLLAAAELNVVLKWQLWPRSLRGDLSAADRRALRRSADAAQHDRRERIAVTFHDAPPGSESSGEVDH